MNEKPFNQVIVQSENQIIVRHSPKRKLLETLFFIFFLAIGILAIVFGAIFNDQSIFFRVSLICIGILVAVIYIDSVISVYRNLILITPDELKFRNILSLQSIDWISIERMELKQRKHRNPQKSDSQRFILLEIHTDDGFEYLLPLFRFRPNEAAMIVEKINSAYGATINSDKKQQLDTNLTSQEISSIKPITDAEIDKQIPPKVEDFEIEENDS